ncbi:MAG: HIT family protein [Pyrobaculum sp.]
MFKIDIPAEPFNGGHVVVEVNSPVLDLSAEELVALKRRIDSVMLVERNKLRPEGFNIYIEGRQVHIIPRWCGDVNVAFFGGLKIIPMSREDVEKIILSELDEPHH